MLDDLLTTGAIISRFIHGMKETYEKIRYPVTSRKCRENKILEAPARRARTEATLDKSAEHFLSDCNDPDEFLDFGNHC